LASRPMAVVLGPLRLVTVATLELLPNPTSPGLARGFVRRVLSQAGIDRLTTEDAALLATELVTNSVIHASTDIILDVIVEDGAVRVGVTDASDVEPVLREQDQEATTGRGLQLVDRVATAWSVVYAENSKTVQFSLVTDLAGPQR
jgi:anti-sigma regulatory factor (Ser/Thr protein kinase)